MNKFNVRISAIGGMLLLVAIAFALAQHDSRLRTRKIDDTNTVPAQPAVPIAFEAGEPAWNTPDPAVSDPIVRGNDNQLGEEEAPPIPPDFSNELPLADDLAEESSGGEAETMENPLRQSAQAFAVVTASGEEPSNPKPAALPAGPPSWLSEGLPSASQAPPPRSTAAPALPPLPSTAQLPSTAFNANSGTAKPNGQPSMNLPTMPAPAVTSPGVPQLLPGSSSPGAPSTASLQPPTSTGIATGPTPSTSSLPSFPSSNSSMSDTQRGAMPATSFPATGLPGQGSALPPTGNAPTTTTSYPQSNPLPGTLTSGSSATPSSAPLGSAPLGNTTPNTMGSSGVGNTGFSNLPAAMPPQGNAFTESNRSNYGALGNAATSPQSSRTSAALTSLVSNEPGSRYLDGSQNPIMLIQKRGPEEVRVGKKATFVITVRNAGNSTAHDVTVVDSIPLGMRFSDANPPVSPTADGILTWKLGEMPAGDERTINLQMIPERQGELGSVATVHFAAQASLRTVATQPKLEIQVDSQGESLIGDSQLIAVTVKNVGTGVARGVRLEADLPPQLRHESGDQHLQAVFPTELAPNQSQRIELRSVAAQPGDAMCVIRALTEDGAEAQQQVPVTIVSPALVAAIEGPRLRYLDRQATYKFKIQNNGTAPATNLKFVVRLPSGLRFNSSDNTLADYNPSDHTVTLGLQELPVGTPAIFELTVLPVERGAQVLTLNAIADLGIETEAKGQVMVEGLAELAFTIGQDNGTIEVGSSSTYTVQVTNIGNNPDKDVRLAVQLPQGAQVLNVDAPVRYRAEGNQIVFEPIAEMRNKDQHTFRFQVQHMQAGSKIVRTQLTSANWPVAVVKEEGTLVYDDQN